MSETEVKTEVQVDDVDDLDTFSAEFFGRNKAEEPKTKGEVEQENENEDKETGAQTPDPNEDPEAEYVETPPKKKTVQDRIDELVRQREDIKREADAKLDALKQEFEAFKNSSTKTAEAPSTSAEPSPDAVDKDGNPLYTLGEFDPAYIRDLTRYTLNQERERVQEEVKVSQARQAEQQAATQLQNEWNGKMETAKTEYPDLVEKGQELLNGFNNLPADYAGYLSTVLMSMDKGPDVLYYLSNHPEEARQIVNSGAQKATLALGRIEAKFLEADAQKTLAKPKVSKAPPPPAERTRGTNGAFISVAPDTDDLDAFAQEFFRRK